jgi:hypothetical protein
MMMLFSLFMGKTKGFWPAPSSLVGKRKIFLGLLMKENPG